MANVDELMDDEALRRFGYFDAATHPSLDRRVFQMGGIRSSRGPDLRSAAPTMGEGNDFVYGEILGLSAEQIESYREDAVI
jgi:hypothetical protein